MQITSAMKMVSAAKLKKATDAIVQMRPYAQKLQEILGNLSSSLDASENPYTQERTVKNVLIVGINSNRGLCGGFNANVVKEVKRLAREEFAGCNVSVLPIGRKMAEAIKGTELNIRGSKLPHNTDLVWDGLNFAKAAPIATDIP